VKEQTQNKRRWGILGRWEFWAGAASIIFAIALSVLIIINPQAIQAMEGYGYLGGFFISVAGGALVLIPVPLLPVQFALGGTMKPAYRPQHIGAAHGGDCMRCR